MVKIAHEAPNSIFHKVQQLTDYDYFLVHLFEENPTYLEHAMESVRTGRETILDNSIFELEEAFEPAGFCKWVKQMKPTWYIVPDVLEDKDGTIENMAAWYESGRMMQCQDSKIIGVVQGKSYEEVVECYNYMKNYADMIAISFDYSFYEDLEKPGNPTEYTKYHKWMYGRQNLLSKMLKDGVIDTSIPHHLLGCGLPQEFSFYKKRGWDWIYSLDTSNPVVHGIKKIWYSADGLQNKESVKLYTMMDDDVTDRWAEIEYNIKSFRAMST